jgi:predicted Zn-dependent protease
MLSLVSESQEIEMGRESDPQIVAAMGRVPNEDLQEYVADIGLRMAAASERPGLPWTFTVLDDPLINAFALPGGFIYVTRGILSYMRSEAELAGVLGHEIGHVTARHSVEQISRQQLLQVGAGVGMILSPTVRENAGLVAQSLQLVTLKFGRDDERQSDDLGLRYMTAQGYDPAHHASVFAMLSEVSGTDGGEIPEWLSTHPNPENREARILEQIEARKVAGESFEVATVGAERFLRMLNGLVVGENPREGFFDDDLFRHPDMAFRLRFPAGWRTQNTRSMVAAVSPQEDAVVVLSLATASDPSQALSEFLAIEGVEGGQRDPAPIGGKEAARATFRATTSQGSLAGMVAYIRHQDVTFELLGYTPATLWQVRGNAVTGWISSFETETDPHVLEIQPHRLEIVELPEAMSTADFLRRFPSVAEEAEVLRLNRVEPDEALPAGRLMKRVVTGI